MEEENKSKDELLQEVKKLREEVEKDNKKKWQNSASNSMILIGSILVFVALFLWRCSGIM